MQKIHRRYGHVDINRLVYHKRKGILHSSLIPTSTKIKYLVKDCPVWLAMKYRKPSTLISKTVVYKEMYEVWEKVYTDTSGSFWVKSIKGNYYYSVFVDEKSGRYIAISYARKSEFPWVFLQFVSKIARFPKILVCDSAGEMLSATMTGTFALHELSLHVVPKGEHFANGPAERAIVLIDNMVKTLLAAHNLTCNTWDILVEHFTLIHAVTGLCPTNKKVTVLVFHHLQKDKQRKQCHSLKLGKKRRESSKRNYYIISPRVIIKAIIII